MYLITIGIIIKTILTLIIIKNKKIIIIKLIFIYLFQLTFLELLNLQLIEPKKVSIYIKYF